MPTLGCHPGGAEGLAPVVCAGYLDAFPRIHRQCEERRAFIRHELAQGKRNIVVPPYESVSLAPYVSVMWRMCSGDPDEFINSSVARYLRIESIRVDVCVATGFPSRGVVLKVPGSGIETRRNGCLTRPAHVVLR